MTHGFIGGSWTRLALASAAAGFVTLWSIPACADVKAGVDAWSAGDYVSAVAQWQPLAAKGDPDAQFNLAQAYKLGRGVPMDLEHAKRLYGEAAAKGHVQAADNYGLLLFQDGDREKAMPYIKASAARGDARAQYILGIAHFNGDLAEKDWVRAYALLTLARQSGLPQATKAMTQMDGYIPLAQRQQSVALAKTMEAQATANRERLATATELGGPAPDALSSAMTKSKSPVPIANRESDAVLQASRVAQGSSPAQAGADYTRSGSAWPAPSVQTPAAPTRPAIPSQTNLASAPPATKAPPPTRTAKAPPALAPAPATAVQGPWQLQLGAFGVAGNADKLWQKVRTRAEIRGHSKHTEPAGRLTKLLVTGYPSRTAAETACHALKSGGFDCLVTSS